MVLGYLLLPTCSMIPVITYGQNVLFKHYTTTDGLPSNTVYSLMQDKQGFIWNSSDAGVTRFDGNSFQNYSIAEGLSDNEILTIMQDSRGRIWFLGFNGTVSYMLNGTIYNEQTDTLLRHIKSLSCFIEMFEDRENRLWFIAQNEGLILNGNHIIKSKDSKVPGYSFVSNLSNGQYIHSCTGNSIFRNGKTTPAPQLYTIKKNGGYTFLANGDQLFVSNQGIVFQKDTSQKLIIPFDSALNQAVQFGIELTSDSLIWVTTNYGIYCYRFKQPEIKPVIYLKDIISSSLLEDHEGNLWVGTLSDGVYLIPAWARHVQIVNDELRLDRIPSYAIGKVGEKIYLGEKNGNIKEVHNRSYKSITVADDKLHGSEMNKMISYGQSVWAASNEKLIHYNSLTGKGHIVYCKNFRTNTLEQTVAIKGFAEGKTYMLAARNYSVVLFPKECTGYLPDSLSPVRGQKIPGCFVTYVTSSNDRKYSVYESKTGTLWYGAKEGLCSMTDNKTNNHSKEHPLLKLRIISIGELEDSTLVLAIHGHGIVLYKNGQILQHLTTQTGLNNDVCRKLYVYKNHIYVATPSGVAILKYANGSVFQTLTLDESNILPFNDVNDVYADANYIFIATSKGLVNINQKVLSHIKTYVPLLRLNEVMVNDKIINLTKENLFTYTQNNFMIRFIGIHYQLPRTVRYRYRLNEDQLWKYTGNTLVEFTFLPPGNYSFELQTKSGGSKWSASIVYPFEIKPPFWNTYWFIALSLLSIAGFIVLTIKYRLSVARKKQQEKQRIENQITSLEQEALQSMMNPHFIFNVMNSIQHFINSNDKRLANIYLSNFAKLIRINLTISYKKYIPIEEELNYLSLYLSFEKLRFGDKLNYTIVVDPSIDTEDTHIAVMMIQPFLENAIEHGILPLSQGGELTLSIDAHNETALRISVTDTGTGIDSRYLTDGFMMLNESHAINITSKRLGLISKVAGQQISFTYSHLHPEAINKGTVVSFLLPLADKTT